MQQDEEHLNLLSVFHYVVGGLAALFACFPIIHLIIGIALVVWAANPDAKGDGPPALVGWLMMGFASLGMIVGWSIAACIIAAGRCLAGRTHYTFCLVMAAIECCFMPFGTVLGIFTIIVLVRQNVKDMFTANQPLYATADSPA